MTLVTMLQLFLGYCPFSDPRLSHLRVWSLSVLQENINSSSLLSTRLLEAVWWECRSGALRNLPIEN